MNYFQKYYNSEAWKTTPNKVTDGTVKSIAKSAPSDKQIALYNDLREFLIAKDIDISWIRNPRSRHEMSSRICTFFTLLKQNNYYEEYVGRED